MLTEQINYEKQVLQDKIKQEMGLVRKEMEFYQKNVKTMKMIENIEKKQSLDSVEKNVKKISRNFKQREVVNKEKGIGLKLFN